MPLMLFLILEDLTIDPLFVLWYNGIVDVDGSSKTTDKDYESD
jgi:hypothetical protein